MPEANANIPDNGTNGAGSPQLGSLVATDWLEANINNPAIRIIDCSAEFHAEPGAGKNSWLNGHIPGSVYVDLLEELSDPDSDLPLMMPTPERFSQVMDGLGLGRDTTAVLYDNAINMCAARLWWMLRANGFDNAVILDGGWRKWNMEHRLTTQAQPNLHKAEFSRQPARTVFVDKQAVLENLQTNRACLIDALAPEVFDGSQQRYARPGHIPGSINVPAKALVNLETAAFLPIDALKKTFAEAGLRVLRPTISYCGGGLAACSVAFALHLLGAEDITVYDASLFEWAADPELPLEVGENTACTQQEKAKKF